MSRDMSRDMTERIAVRLNPALALNVGAAALGITVLLLRGVTWASVGATGLVGVIGLVPAMAQRERVRTLRWLLIASVGIAAFALGRTLSGGPGIQADTLGKLSLVVAAVCEEAFFRRFLYGLIEPRSAFAAAAITTVLFALVHLPMYGIRAMPIDLAAGALLAWQRWASGTWTASAVTHVFVNLIQIG